MLIYLTFELNETLFEKVKNGAVLDKPDKWPEGQVAMYYKESDCHLSNSSGKDTCYKTC